MRIPLKWLKELVATGLPTEELSDRLTMAGFEVEAVEQVEDDTVLDVNVLPNRPDCLSILGVAREVSAILGARLVMPPNKIPKGPASDVRIEIDDPALCGRYAGRVISGVSVGESPDWLKKKLSAYGIRSINNIVDVTNYVLVEFGHPLHAFDMDKLRDGLIRVAVAGKGRKITTLDGAERELPEDALLIWDAEKPVAVAGVMGGAETEVSETTKNVFLESAHFLPVSVRRTSKKLGLRSESSYRFERGTDIEMLASALDRAALLISDLAGGKIHERVDSYPRKFKPTKIKVSYDRINRVLGTTLTGEEISASLGRLDIGLKPGAKHIVITPPAYRLDLDGDAHVIEEAARLHGYGNIPTTLPRAPLAGGQTKPGRKLIRAVAQSLLKSGFSEAINFSFMDERHLDLLRIPDGDARRRCVKLLNPLSSDASVLRTFLLPSLVANFLHNYSRGVSDVMLFEASRVFQGPAAPLPSEPVFVGGIFHREKLHTFWKEPADAFYVLKGVVESLLHDLGICKPGFKPSAEPFLHPGRSADVYAGRVKVGYSGILSPQVIESLELKTRPEVGVFELSLEALSTAIPSAPTYSAIPKFPAVERDFAIIVDDEITAGDIIKLIKSFPSELIEHVSVFDMYKGKGIPEGRKSLAFNIVYRSGKRTLKDDEVSDVHNRLIDDVVRKTRGEIRK